MDHDEKSAFRNRSQATESTQDGQPAPSPNRSDEELLSLPPPSPARSSIYPGSPQRSMERDRQRWTNSDKRPMASYGERPEMAGSSKDPISQPWVPLNRKPVQRRTVSDGSAARDSFAGQSQATLRPTPLNLRTDGTSTTSVLFSQASRSLTSLAGSLRLTSPAGTEERPPPYADQTTNPMPHGTNITRQDTSTSRREPTDLMQVIRENRFERLRKMLERGLNIDEVDAHTKRTAIMEAAHLRHSKCAQLLVHAGCRLHLRDPEGNTALHFAAAQGDAEICRLILDANAQLDEYNLFGETPMQMAARGGYTEAVLCLLNSWTLRRATGASLLVGFMEATKSGNVGTAEVFVERGIQPKKVEEAWRLVANAAESGSIPMLDFLEFHKVDLKQRNPDGWTALHFASALGHTAMVEKLLAWKLPWKAQTKKTKETALHLAILGQHTATAMALIFHKDARITMEDTDGQQPIHHAARNGDGALVTALLNQGLLINKGSKQEDHNKYGWTPMLLACAYGHIHLVAEFVTRGVSVDERLDFPAVNPSKKTNEAAKKGYWAEIRWPHSGARPLHLALEFGHDEVANTLIAAGAKTEDSDAAGWKPLHYAAFSARYRMVELLLSKGASPHATTHDGNTPLSIGFRENGLTATYEEKERIYELLQAAMHARKKSKFKALHSFLNAGVNKSKEVRDRNRIWHLAGLADALCQSGQLMLDEDEDEEASVVTPTTSIQPSLDERYDDETIASPSSARPPSRITKRMTD